MTWIIGLGGFIHYKSSWTSPSDVESTLEAILDFQTNRAKNEWVAFYSERSAWSTRDLAQFKEGLSRNGPQAVADFERMLQRTGALRAAPSDDVEPRLPGNFYKTEAESGR